MKTIVIIGGGISGLTAGIYLQSAGFKTIIFEKNKVPGGECTGWKRDGFTIDNCIRWLTDSKDGSLMNQVWKNIGMLGKDVGLYKREFFYAYHMDGKTVTFWRDLEQTRKEMLELSPEDADAIEKLISNVKKAECRHVPVKKPMDQMRIKDFMEMASSMREIPEVEKAYQGMGIIELAESFKSPVLNKAIRSMIFEQNKASFFVFSYATITGGNGDIPLGGSLKAALRIAERYQEIGGDLRLGVPVRNVIIEKKRAAGVILEGGYQIEADYVVCATDINHIFAHLLPEKYMPQPLKEKFANPDRYFTYSSFHVSFAIDETGIIPSGINIYECEGFTIAHSKVNQLKVICFDYDSSLAPEGQTIIQVQVLQGLEDFDQWVNLRESDPLTYEKRKSNYAGVIQGLLEKEFPAIRGKLSLLDVWTPATYAKSCNAYKGAFMTFAEGKAVNSKAIPGVIKGLDNVFIANQWLTGTGGLPMAAAAGKFAAWRIEKKESHF